VLAKIVDPLQAIGLSKRDASLLCTSIAQVVGSLSTMVMVSQGARDNYVAQWTKFMVVIEAMVVTMYDM
jgi:hypothetical protein